jgi:deoxyribodipyrimidine photolyase-related protein
MWAGQPWLYHAHLSAALNLKLLNPREVVAAEAAWRAGRAPLAACRGLRPPDPGLARVRARRLLDADAELPPSATRWARRQALPAFYWTGDTDMACLRDAITQTLRSATPTTSSA